MSGGVVPKHIAGDLLSLLERGHATVSERGYVYRYRPPASTLRELLAETEAHDAAALAEYLRSLAPTRWYRR